VATLQPSRRAVLAGLAAGFAAPKIGWAAAGNPAFLACAKEVNGTFALHGLNAHGESQFKIPLPQRGHAGAHHPVRAEAVVFARRPGTFALVIDAISGKPSASLAPPSGSHFNGHGAYLQGGELLVTAEQIAETSEGRLGLWAANENYRRIGDVPSGGVGPHEILALKNGTLAIANGGIKTLPGSREEIGKEDMRPNLAFAGSDGRLIDVLEPAAENRFASIRHLAELPDASVAAALQWHGGAERQSAPLLIIGAMGGAIRMSTAPQRLWDHAKGYAASIAANADGTIALTAPRGNCLFLFDQTGEHVATHSSFDVSGVAAADNGFMASTGEGAMLVVTSDHIGKATASPVAWDNHIIALA
jgi:uncharacterized protein